MTRLHSFIFVSGGIAGLVDGSQGIVLPGICIIAGLAMLLLGESEHSTESAQEAPSAGASDAAFSGPIL